MKKEKKITNIKNDYSDTYPEEFFELFGSLTNGISEPSELKMDEKKISIDN